MRSQGMIIWTGLRHSGTAFFAVQDVSSMLAGELADPPKGAEVLDVCAAPGGKALHAAERMEGTGHVQARDLTEKKVDLIRENIEQAELENIDAEVWDAAVFDEEFEEKADLVIADLPLFRTGRPGEKRRTSDIRRPRRERKRW